MSVCEFDNEKFLDGQADQCLRYIKKNGVRWWHSEYKPKLLKHWGAERVQQLIERMNVRKQRGKS